MESSLPAVEGGNPSQLLSMGEDTPGTLVCLIIRKGQSCAGERPVKGHKDAERM